MPNHDQHYMDHNAAVPQRWEILYHFEATAWVAAVGDQISD